MFSIPYPIKSQTNWSQFRDKTPSTVIEEILSKQYKAITKHKEHIYVSTTKFACSLISLVLYTSWALKGRCDVIFFRIVVFKFAHNFTWRNPRLFSSLLWINTMQKYIWVTRYFLSFTNVKLIGIWLTCHKQKFKMNSYRLVHLIFLFVLFFCVFVLLLMIK